MNTQLIKERFQDNLTMDEYIFLNFIKFQELKNFYIGHRNEGDENIYIGKVNNKYFWYKEQDCKVWYDQWGFLDEIGVEQYENQIHKWFDGVVIDTDESCKFFHSDLAGNLPIIGNIYDVSAETREYKCYIHHIIYGVYYGVYYLKICK